MSLRNLALRALCRAGNDLVVLATRRGLPFTLRVRSAGCGLFGDLFISLNGIRAAELGGRDCEVAWGKNSLYFNQASGPNAWEYFFEQSSYNLGSGGATSKRLRLTALPRANAFTRYPGLTTRESVEIAIRRFCRVRREVRNDVRETQEGLLGSMPYVGVHLRLTDAAAGNENRVTTLLEHYLAETHDRIAQYPNARVFVASDDQRAVDEFRTEFGEKVVFRDVTRSYDGTSIHGHYDGGAAIDGYTKGREALVDALLLSSSLHLIRGHSRLTAFSLCLNPTLRFTDIDRKYRYGTDRLPWLR